jgi:hypothetical protein
VGDREPHPEKEGHSLEEDAEGVQRMIVVKAIVVIGVVLGVTVFYAAVLAVASEEIEYEERD